MRQLIFNPPCPVVSLIHIVIIYTIYTLVFRKEILLNGMVYIETYLACQLLLYVRKQ